MKTMTDVVNVALARIGSDPIEAVDEETKEGRLASTLFAASVEAELRLGSWRFSERVASLARLDETPPDFLYAYGLPPDFLRAISMSPGGYEWAVRDWKVVTDAESVLLTYTARILNPAVWDSLFFDVVSYRLAAELAYAVGASQTLSQQMWAARDALVGRARMVSLSERGRERSVDTWILSRG